MGLKNLLSKAFGGGGEAPEPEVQRHLAALDDPDPKVRLRACEALGALGERARSAVPRLEDLIEDEDGDVCNAAACALSDITRHT